MQSLPTPMIASACIGLILAGCNSTPSRVGSGDDAAPGQSPVVTLQKDSWQATGPFLTVDGSCKLIASGKIRILSEPRHGTVRVTRHTGSPLFSPGHRLEHCNTSRHTGEGVFYRPNRGFIGEDSYTYEVLFRDGERRVIRPTLQVNEGFDKVRPPSAFGIRL
jgi:hypothetical protein